MNTSTLPHSALVAMAGFAILGWHFLFWMFISPTPFPIPLSAPRQSIRYVPVQDSGPGQGLASGQARAIWSPILFSLPSEAGFSKSIRQTQSDISPPLDTQEDLSVMLPRPRRGTASGVAIVRPSLLETLARQQVAHLRVPAVSASFPAPPSGEAGAIGMTTEGALTLNHVAGLILPEPLREKPGGDWMLVLALETDAFGFVQHVFVETSCGDVKLDEAVIQSLYRNPLAGVTGPVSGRLTLQRGGPPPHRSEEEG